MDVLVNFSLVFMVAAGIVYLALPVHVLGIPKSDFTGVLRLWGSSLKLFAIPLCLLVLNFTKHVIVQIASLAFALWTLFVTVLFFLSSKEHAPDLTLYGRAFLASIIIFSLCGFIFSAIKFLPKSLNFGHTDDPPVNPS